MADTVSSLSSKGHSSPSQTFSSSHDSPHETYSPLYPVHPEQERGNPVGTHKSQLSAGGESFDYTHPAIASPGLESVWTGYDGDAQKEVVPPQAPPYPEDKYLNIDAHGRPRGRLLCGLPFWLCVLLLALVALILVGVALGVGLGVGLKKSSSSGLAAFNPQWLSKTGAFNGTGLAIASYSFDNGGYGVLNVYFQHWTGQLRKMQLMNDGTWGGGDETTIIATNAKNGTPISAVAYAMDYASTWHIFYIDTENIVRERISDNTTNTWRDGPIGQLNLTAMNHPNVGLQACWYGSFYGTANYVHSPIPGTGSNTTSQDSVIGMHLWYGTDPYTQEEVNWTYNTTQWYLQDNFTANGHAGVGCYSWGPGSVSYVMMVNLDNDVNVMWKDLNSTAMTTDTHPVNKWTNTSVSIPNVMPNTSLGYTNFFYAQLADGSISGYNISFDAEETTIMNSSTFEIQQKPLAGTHFSVTSIPTPSGGNELIVFAQENGTDITENLRDFSSGQWSYRSLPIPNS